MNKSQQQMEQMAALVMLAFTIGLLVGETLRDALYGAPATTQTDAADPPAVTETAQSKTRRKWQLYSGLFIVLKRKITLPARQLRTLRTQTLAAFAQLVQPLPVPT